MLEHGSVRRRALKRLRPHAPNAPLRSRSVSKYRPLTGQGLVPSQAVFPELTS
jgi:hypothetical protein